MLNDILEYQVSTPQAAEILGVSERHTRRLLNAYRRDGAAALPHGNRGRQPHNAASESEAAAVVRLASTKYAGTNHTHLTELLWEREGINLSRPTVRRILVKAGAPAARAAAVPSSTECAGSECPRRECWCRLTAATTAGLGRMGPGLPCY